MFKVAEPIITSNNATVVKAEKTTSALNDGVKLSDVNVHLGKSMARNRTKRQRSAVRARQAMKY